MNSRLERITNIAKSLLSRIEISPIISRVVALLVINALLLPTIFFQPFYKVSAANNLPIQPMPAILTAPPEVYSFGSNSWQTALGTSGWQTTLATTFSTWFGTIFKATPKTPAGLENGKIVISPSVESSKVANENSLNSENSTSLNSANSANLLLPDGDISFDVDVDGKADLARWQSSTQEWKVKKSSDNSLVTATIGSATSKITPGDFDGDGKTDMAVFTNGTWTIKKSSDGSTQTISFGQAGDIPLVGRYDGDSISDVAVYRSGAWYIRNSSDGSTTSYSFGNSTDIPLVGNFDGDSKTDIVVFRPSDGNWYLLLSGSSYGFSSFHWGISTDIPVPANYDEDNKTDFAVYRPLNGTWYVYKSYNNNNGSYIAQTWGNYGDQPVPADYDGDGKADFTVWRPTTGVWYSINSGNQAYNNRTFGIPGDTVVESAYLKQIGGNVSASALAKARLSPKNETGGTSLYSRNFGWGTGLAGLSGRGLNAGFGMSYNSLIWTRQGNTMYFDVDNSNITPGFRFGFPTIEPSYLSSDTGAFAYLMVSPSGDRTEFRQEAASKFYTTADSSYTRLELKGNNTPNSTEENTITVTSTDGTQMDFEWKAGAYRAKQVKDRNGNYITIVHNDFGLLQSVTDTLGRVINVNYDADYYPTTITQTWKDNNGSGSNVTHNYATLSYTNININTNFTENNNALNVYGPPNGYYLKVLDKVTYTDGTYTKFEYNPYGQVWRILNYPTVGDKLNYVSVDLPNPGAVSDCPRFTETHSWVKDFNRENGTGNEQEVIVYNDFTENYTYDLPSGGTAVGNKITVTSTDGNGGTLVSKTFTGASGWQEGLPMVTEDYSNGTKKRWTQTTYTQDDTVSNYITNPRVTETKIGDTENNYVRRTTIDYWKQYGSTQVALYGLPKYTKVYDTDQTTVLKQSYTEYNLDTAYTNRRIIGLPSKSESYGLENGILKLTGKTTYLYDEDDFSFDSGAGNISPIQHDNTNYGASFTIGRGNLTSTKNWNTEYPTDSSQAINGNSIKYNTAGSPIASIDILGRTIKTSYTDNFNDGINNRGTFAYPTTLTDPNGNSSNIKYRFDIGANVWAKSPTIDGNAANSGKESTREFDTLGRLTKESLWRHNGSAMVVNSYARYEYPTNGIQAQVYSTITDTNNNGIADSADEVLSESWTDGAGRTRKSRTPLNFDTSGNPSAWSGTIVEYDVLGRVKRSTVPTEVNSSWTPSGDDSIYPNFLWTAQDYDWKGRPIKQYNTDGTYKIISYNGCGCAGGQVTTIQSEEVPRDDVANTNARRMQKSYSDILGRTYKTESYKWDGTTVYSTVKTTFNASDQAILTRQYDGSESSGNFQDTTATFDGFGRMKTQHLPQQQVTNNGADAYTTWNYLPDGRIENVTDARGATANYVYKTTGNNLGMLEQISYTSPDASVPITPTSTFTYNNLGMKTSMVDGLGNISYVYNNLGQMTSETRQFNESLPQAPSANNSFKLEYTYAMGGQLKSYKDPYGQEFNYGFDKVGRLNSITGSTSFGGVTNYLNNPSYRAFGALKHLEYGDNNAQMNQTFDNRLRVGNFEVTKNGSNVIKQSYQYNNDNALNSNTNDVNTAFNRSYTYDFMGRIKTERTNDVPTNFANPPYTTKAISQEFIYDAFGHNLARHGDSWGAMTDGVGLDDNYNPNTNAPFYQYQKNRLQDTVSTYDKEGNQVGNIYDANTFNKFESSGQLKTIQSYASTSTFNRDGKGNNIKKVSRYRVGSGPGSGYGDEKKNYIITSTVLDERVITEVKDTGAKVRTYIYASGQILARQDVGVNGDQKVNWRHLDASGKTERYSYVNGFAASTRGQANNELDANGFSIQISSLDDGSVNIQEPVYFNLAVVPDGHCVVEGEVMPCTMADALTKYLKMVSDTIEAAREKGNAAVVRQESAPIGLDGINPKPSSYASKATEKYVEGLGKQNDMAGESSIKKITDLIFTDDVIEGVVKETVVVKIDECPKGQVKNPKTGKCENKKEEDKLTKIDTSSSVPPPPSPTHTELSALKSVLDTAKNTLTNANDLCTQALQKIGILGRMLAKLPNTVFLNATKDTNSKATDFFTTKGDYAAKKGENFMTYLNRIFKNNPQDMAVSSPKGILTVNGTSDFVGENGWFLHELAHHTTGLDDSQLVSRLNLAPDPTTNNASQRLSNYFNNGCPSNMVLPARQRKGGRK